MSQEGKLAPLKLRPYAAAAQVHLSRPWRCFTQGYRAFNTTADTPCTGVPLKKPAPRTEVGIKE